MRMFSSVNDSLDVGVGLVLLRQGSGPGFTRRARK